MEMVMNRDEVVISKNIEREKWNGFVASSPWGHLMQSWEWGGL